MSKKIKINSSKFFFEQFGYKAIDHICLNKDFMINQKNLMLNQNIACELDFQPNAQSVI